MLQAGLQEDFNDSISNCAQDNIECNDKQGNYCTHDSTDANKD